MSAVGLSSADAAARRATVGPNRLPEPPRRSAVLRLLAQLANPLVLTLLAAAVVATVVGAFHGGGGWLERFGDAIAIVLIVCLNAALGFYQEHKAETALAALHQLEVPHARACHSCAARRGGGPSYWHES